MKAIALRSQTFTVFGQLFSLNAERKLNRFARAKRVKEWRDAAKSVAMHPSQGPIVPFRHVHIDVEVHQKFGTLADTVGHVPAFKAVLDGLVDAGVIAGDDGSYVERVSFHAPVRAKGLPRLLVTLTEVA